MRECAADDAHLYLWTINAYVEDAYAVVRAWGFEPSTLLVWAKKPLGSGLGPSFGISTEFVLFARRGALPHKKHHSGTCFRWKRARHSEKPEAFYREVVEKVSPGPLPRALRPGLARGLERVGERQHPRAPPPGHRPGGEPGTVTPAGDRRGTGGRTRAKEKLAEETS